MENIAALPAPEAAPAPATQPAPSLVATLQAIGPAPTESTLPKQYNEAYRMRLAGHGMQEIADTFGVDRTTVWRWCCKVEEEAQTQLANEPIFNIVAREVSRLTDLEEQARTAAETAKSDRAKALYLSEARRAAVSRQQLLLSTGIVPKAPEQIFRVTADMKPDDGTRKAPLIIPRDEAIQQLIDSMQRVRTVE